MPIKVKNKVYEVAHAQNTPGIPKSDFHFVNMDGIPITWISHKDGKYPYDFQQWSGVSEKGIVDNPETQRFIKEINQKYPEGIPTATTIAKKINTTVIKNRSVYGRDFGKQYGIHNVNIVIQGDVNFQKNGTNYTIMANKVHYNGEIISGGYEPTYMCTYKGDRDQMGVKGARFSISPIRARRVDAWI